VAGTGGGVDAPNIRRKEEPEEDDRAGFEAAGAAEEPRGDEGFRGEEFADDVATTAVLEGATGAGGTGDDSRMGRATGVSSSPSSWNSSSNMVPPLVLMLARSLLERFVAAAVARGRGSVLGAAGADEDRPEPECLLALKRAMGGRESEAPSASDFVRSVAALSGERAASYQMYPSVCARQS
jgi:hypothetical protein